MKTESDIQTSALAAALKEALTTYRPSHVLVLTDTDPDQHWSSELLSEAAQSGTIVSSRIENRRVLKEENYPTYEGIEAFNKSVYSPLRRSSKEELEQKLEAERSSYLSREIISDIEVAELDHFDFVLIDDFFFASNALAKKFIQTRYLFLTGIKTFQGYPIYSRLLKREESNLLHDDHSVGTGFSLFENLPSDALEDPICEEFETEETASQPADRFDYSKNGAPTSALQETLTSIVRDSKARTVLELTQKPNSLAALHNALVQAGGEHTIVKQITTTMLQNSLAEFADSVDLIVIDTETEDAELALEIISHSISGKARVVAYHSDEEIVAKLIQRIDDSAFYTLLSEDEDSPQFLVAFCDEARKQKQASLSQARKSYLIVAPPEPDKAFHTYALVDAIAKTGGATELFVVCERESEELFGRISAITKLFAYKATDLNGNRKQMKGLVSNLHLLSPERVIILTEEENILSALLTYRFSGDDIPVDTWGELLGAHTTFSKETLRDFTKIANLPTPTFGHPFPRSSWEDKWAERFCDKHNLTKENTLLLISNGNYPLRQYLQALTPLLDRGEYTLVTVGESDEMLVQLEEMGKVVSIDFPLSLGQLAALLSRSRVVIGGESIPFYLSTVLNLPHVLVAGGGSLNQNFPRTKRTVVACLPFACFDCEWGCRYNNESCLEELPPEIVRKAVGFALEADQARMKVIFKSDRTLGEGCAEEAHLALLGDTGIDLIPIIENDPNG